MPRLGNLLFAVRVIEQISLVRQLRTQALQAKELFEGAAVIALGLDAITERKVHQVRLLCDAPEPFGEVEIPVLLAGNFDIAANHVRDHAGDWVVVGIDGIVQGGGEEAGIETGGAEDELLRDGHALEREHFLGVDRAIAGDEVGFEIADLVDVFEADDAEGRGGEGVRAISTRLSGCFRRRGVLSLGHRCSTRKLA